MSPVHFHSPSFLKTVHYHHRQHRRRHGAFAVGHMYTTQKHLPSLEGIGHESSFLFNSSKKAQKQSRQFHGQAGNAYAMHQRPGKQTSFRKRDSIEGLFQGTVRTFYTRGNGRGGEKGGEKERIPKVQTRNQFKMKYLELS